MAEVQTPSDTTFRVYDWTKEYNRPHRELHIEQALACADFGEPPAPSAHTGDRSVVAEPPYYIMETVRASCRAVDLSNDTSGPLVVMLPRTMGAGIASRSGSFDEVAMQRGQTCVIPASLAADAILRAGPDTEAVVAGAI